MLELKDAELEEEATELELVEAAGETAWDLARPMRMPNSPVGRWMATHGISMRVEKPPPRYSADLVRGQSGFEIHCGGGKPQINVVFGIFNKPLPTRPGFEFASNQKLAFYLFSSTVDPKSRDACRKSKATPTVRVFGVSSQGFDSRIGFKNKIGVHELVTDAKSPSASIQVSCDIACGCLLKLRTRSNGLVALNFALDKLAEPSIGINPIPGKVFFLGVGDFNEAEFQNNPLRPVGLSARATRIAISNF
jgi:hypothetical protein